MKEDNKEVTETPNIKAIKTDIYLAEYNALRQEMLQDIKIRQSLIITTWVFIGAVLVFALTKLGQEENILKQIILVALPYITTALFFLWTETQSRIESFHIYLKDYISKKIRAEMGQFEPIYKKGEITDGLLMGWEGSRTRGKAAKLRSLFKIILMISTFVIIPFVVLVNAKDLENKSKTEALSKKEVILKIEAKSEKEVSIKIEAVSKKEITPKIEAVSKKEVIPKIGAVSKKEVIPKSKDKTDKSKDIIEIFRHIGFFLLTLVLFLIIYIEIKRHFKECIERLKRYLKMRKYKLKKIRVRN